LKILITNYVLDNYSGTEVVARDLALELKRQGHDPCVFARKLGPISREVERDGIEVVSDLSALRTIPEIIHGHHHSQFMEAFLRFPSIPAVSVCHDANFRLDEPVFFPRILRYVAVDNRCRKRLENAADIPASRIEVILNAVDLDRFHPRGPLPSKPKHALVFSNQRRQLSAVRKACKRMGLTLDVLGGNTAAPNPESILPRYDIVFAKARCALEAMAVGNTVILCDFSGIGPLVTTENFSALRWMNFGQGALANPLQSKYLECEIEKYDVADANKVSVRARSEASLSDAVKRWVELYNSVITEFHDTETDTNAEFQALADYLRKWTYESRVDWEMGQFQRLRELPLMGNSIFRVARRALHWWRDRARSKWVGAT